MINIKKPIDEELEFFHRHANTWRRNAKISNTRIIVTSSSSLSPSRINSRKNHRRKKQNQHHREQQSSSMQYKQ